MTSCFKNACGVMMVGALLIVPHPLNAGSTYSLNLTAATDDYVDVAASPSLTPTPLTFEAWVYARSVKSSTIISRGDGGNGATTDYIFQLNPSSPNEDVSLFGVDAWNYSANVFPLNTWTHVAVTFDGTTMLFYINGNPAGTNSRPGSLYLSGSDMYIGRQGSVCNCNFFDGYLSEVRIWNVIRSPGQIKANMNLILSGPQPGLVAYYHLNEGSGTVANDASGNSHTGTLHDSASWVASVPPLTNSTYTLASSTLWEGPASGSDSIVLSAPAGWTATTNATWLHLNVANQSGTGSTNVIFSFDANTGSTRTNTITIAGQTLTIVQAGSGYGAANGVTTLASGFSVPTGISLDAAGNVYVVDSNNNAVKKWAPTNNTVTTVVGSGLSFPQGAVPDAAGDLYITEALSPGFLEWNAASNTLASPASITYPAGLAIDGAGNVYIADGGSHGIDKWNVASNHLSTVLASLQGVVSHLALDACGNLYFTFSGFSSNYVMEVKATTGQTATNFTVTDTAQGVAVDVSGNIYYTHYSGSALGTLTKWSAATNGFVNLTSSPSNPSSVAVDGLRNLYLLDQNGYLLREIPNAYVNTNTVLLYGNATTNALLAVLPTAESLAGPFAPTTDQPWLGIVGVTNGIISYSLAANTNSPATNRVGHVIVFGQAVPILQTGAAYALSTNELFEAPAAGTDSVILTTPAPTNTWTATTTYPWLHLSGTNQSGTGSQMVTFTFDANTGYPRTGVITIAGLTLVVSQASSFALSTNTLYEPAASGTGSVALASVPAGTNWTAAANAPWLHLTPANQSGSGSATITFTFDANSGGTRSGTLTIAGLTLTVNQGSVYYFTPASLLEPPGSGGDSAMLSGVLATNSWTASSTNSWLHVSAASQSGTGDTNISFTFDANSGPTRLGSVVVGGVFLTVTQEASSYALSTYQMNVPVAGGTNSILLEGVPTNESWTAAANAPWLHLNPTNQAGMGSENISFSYDTNFGVARSGTITIALLTLTVVQATSYTLTPSAFSEPMNAGSDSAMLTGVPSTNAWTASTTASWLHITPASQSGTGNATIAFTYDANPGLPRFGIINISNQVQMTVSQYGQPALSTYVRVEAPAAGADNVLLAGLDPTNVWTATNNAGWLHVSATNQTGVGNGSVLFTFDANPSLPRTGTLTIDGITLTVTQAGGGYASARPVTSLGIIGFGEPLEVATADSQGNVFYIDSEVRGWTPTNNEVTPLATLNCGPTYAQSMAVDRSDNLYYEDGCNNLIQWSVPQAASKTLIPLAGYNIYTGSAMACDAAEDVYISDAATSIYEWTAASGAFRKLPLPIPNGYYLSCSTADAAGNVYYVLQYDNGIYRWPAGGGSVAEIGTAELSDVQAMAVDGAGNLYFGCGLYATIPNSLVEWNGMTGSLTTWTFSGFAGGQPPTLAIDDTGNVYADFGAISEMPNAYVNTNGLSEPSGAGSDSLPVVVPATADLNGPFQSSSDSSWLTVTGATNGVVSFSFQANTNQTRVGHIFVLGQAVPITQAAAVVTPPVLNISPAPIGGGFQVSFTNNQGVTNFTILTTTNLGLPFSAWTVVGPVSNTASNQFQFTIPVIPGQPQSYYNVRSP